MDYTIRAISDGEIIDSAEAFNETDAWEAFTIMLTGMRDVRRRTPDEADITVQLIGEQDNVIAEETLTN